jgi:hypothetical protein
MVIRNQRLKEIETVSSRKQENEYRSNGEVQKHNDHLRNVDAAVIIDTLSAQKPTA